MKLKNFITIFLTVIIFSGMSCSYGQKQSGKTSLSASEFSEKVNFIPSAPVIDVRTTGEFSSGHIQNAKNIVWGGNDFDKQISNFDKRKPVFIYCLSGSRSSAAANKMRSEGFKEVYELSGGIMKWKAANKIFTSDVEQKEEGMTAEQYKELIKSDKLTLVDFYADWCIPCKEMKPYLDEIDNNMKDKVKLVRINADENESLCKELKISGLPYLLLYKDNTLAWEYSGFIGKKDLFNKLLSN